MRVLGGRSWLGTAANSQSPCARHTHSLHSLFAFKPVVVACLVSPFAFKPVTAVALAVGFTLSFGWCAG